MTLRDDLLPVVDELRGLPGALGFRVYSSVSAIKKVWTGGRPGVGTATTTTTAITVGGHPPKVEEVSSQDIIASGGLYHAEDLRVGPMTPYSGGVTGAMIEPPLAVGNELIWVVVGPGTASAGDYYHRLTSHTDNALGWYVTLRRTGARP